ncbi:MAG: hypothetical protein M1828_002515 [Chrysothrix sp. TS-e1954]|nr:MAG: hypothetical protein M1828_002515 [Chrysothrix sp. TS-e1954]
MAATSGSDMQLTDTTANPSAGRPGAVTFIFPREETPFATRIIMHKNSKWTPGAHWHERYVEYFRVLQGRVRIITNGMPREVVESDGEQQIDKYVVHEFMRADVDAESGEGDDADVVVEERVEPADGTKEVFFRNVFGVLQDSDRAFGRWTALQITLTCAHLDNFDVYLAGPLQYYATHVIHAIAKVCGPMAGFQPWYNNYTPERMRSIAASACNTHSKVA